GSQALPRRIGPDRLFAFPLLALRLVEMRAAEARVAARIGRPAEPDLVPGPRVRVEGLDDVAHHDRPGAADAERVPGAAVELGFREVAADRLPQLRVGVGERVGAATLGLLVEPARDAAPELAVRRQVVVLIAVEPARVELVVDGGENRD